MAGWEQRGQPKQEQGRQERRRGLAMPGDLALREQEQEQEHKRMLPDGLASPLRLRPPCPRIGSCIRSRAAAAATTSAAATAASVNLIPIFTMARRKICKCRGVDIPTD